MIMATLKYMYMVYKHLTIQENEFGRDKVIEIPEK